MRVNITFAELDDEKQIKKLLSDANLPYNDILKHIDNFLVAKNEEKIIGVVGIEILEDVGLLRSLAVTSSERGNGIGKLLCDGMNSYASIQGTKKLYLLTITAESFFENLDFKKISREDVADIIKTTTEYSEICPVSAVVMVKEISGETFHYPQK